MMVKNTALVAVFFLSACSTIPTLGVPATPGELNASYGYIPIDPLPVDQIRGHDSCGTAEQGQQGQRQPQEQANGEARITESLPDFSVRYAIAQYSGGGGIQYGPTQTTVRNENYRAVLDYTNVDVVPVEFLVQKKISDTWYPLDSVVTGGIEAYQAIPVRAGDQPLGLFRDAGGAPIDRSNYTSITFPVYIGIGLRLSADIRALRGNISLSGLSVIGAEADANNLTGTLTIQTIGLAGGRIGSALPLPSKLDQTTIENSILSIGTSRALVYNDADDYDEASVITTPRVLGLHSPVGSDPHLINAIYSALSEAPVPWERPCST